MTLCLVAVPSPRIPHCGSLDTLVPRRSSGSTCKHVTTWKWRIERYVDGLSARSLLARLERDGWVGRHGGDHDVYKHPARPGRIIVPRHRTLSPGVARAIAKVAGWQG